MEKLSRFEKFTDQLVRDFDWQLSGSNKSLPGFRYEC